ncbi:Fic family protein [Loigolactobacillus jiayinensis]|uniref:Fic family protein n=1 Tax=Loigolactobacillus jiayinensis TaxID=2486016 RepID=A0ABW1R9H5_9LACO|nr:Fic family protein [Loigolactobacillus jiayinensis]
MNNTALARFITSLGSLNDYGSTLAQTKEALDKNSTKPLNQSKDDIAIFKDALKGIKAIKKIGFNTDGIIAINKEFDSPSGEQPNWPGHLRNANYNEDDNIAVTVDKNARIHHIPPQVITRSDIDQIINTYNKSDKHEKDAWRVFADLSKLQPFQDGNKRTALIAANAAYGTFQKENYLVLPFNDLDHAEFMINLMRYYVAKTPEEQHKTFSRMMELLPSKREVLLHKPIEMQENQAQTKKFNVKPQFRDFNSRER